ncbi:hypothetical protein GOM49_00585 [Clostridium bovifaecis]|uniref:Uncharacterized protein n=1 Tax=Clostridium bovifaecis TaxID=2184719 RepID=A0A6I6EST4_9CLOT|nr:hypothetical protein GOM49_00585 [Clostridium bovifaecis]
MDFLVKERAEGSDPGLCVAEFEKLKDYQTLMDYCMKNKIYNWHTCIKEQLRKY